MNVNNSFVCDRKTNLETAIGSRDWRLSSPVSLSALVGIPLAFRDFNTGKTWSLTSIQKEFHGKPAQAELKLIKNRKAAKKIDR